MNISTNFNSDTNKYDYWDFDYWDLDNGDLFLSFDRDPDELEPAIFMKAVECRDGEEDKYYVLDLQAGKLYSDVNNYPIDKLIEQKFTIDI